MTNLELLTKIKNEFIKYEDITETDAKTFINKMITKGFLKKGYKNYLEISDTLYNQYLQGINENKVPTL